MNKVIVFGNVTRDIELKATTNGTKVANFSIAVNRKWKDQAGAMQEEVEFANIVAFGNQAETIAQYVRKGSKLLVEGRMKTRDWEDTETKKKMYRTEVMLERFEFGGGASEGGNTAKPTTANGEEQDQDINPEDIPF